MNQGEYNEAYNEGYHQGIEVCKARIRQLEYLVRDLTDRNMELVKFIAEGKALQTPSIIMEKPK